ncbi:MAG: hypothetical protein IPK73_30260 [Candidatus Obscuribacter sp.]|nr:hypothetical protein [Candidatus Obscuribacter sp.]
MAEFLGLFHRYGYIYKSKFGGEWFSAQEKWCLSDTEILKAIACEHPKFILGTRAAKASRFAVLDIDAGSKYHNSKSLEKLVATLSAAGLKESRLYRSSFSGGWHLYIFFEEPISSKDLRRQLVRLLELTGFVVAKGVLEVFPCPGDRSLGNGIRLPLQEGFAFLDLATQEVRYEREELSPTKALETFIDHLNGCANSWHDFHRMRAYVERLTESQQQITTDIQERSVRQGVLLPFKRLSKGEPDSSASDIVFGVFQALPPGMISENWVRGRSYYQVGLTGPSQRADALVCLSHYLFYGDPENRLLPLGYGYDQERKFAIEKILELKHNGHSREITRGSGDAKEQIERVSAWLPLRLRGSAEHQRYENKTPIAWQRNSANLKADARARIAAAVSEFESDGLSFSNRDLAARAKCSTDTLYKHQDLWKSAQSKLRSGQSCLAADPGEYNVVVGADSQQSSPHSQSQFQVMPPGRLAARRIVDELKLRQLRLEKQIKKDRRIQGRVASDTWQERIRSITPADFSMIDVKEIRKLLAVYLSALPTSPDEDAQVWLASLIATAKSRLISHQLCYSEPGIPPETG